MWRNNVFVQITGLILGVSTLSACQPEAQTTPNVKFEAPARILQARAVNKSQLRPLVQLSDGTPIQMQLTGDNTWSGTINVEPNNTYIVSVEWIETLPDGEFEGEFDKTLLLATWSDSVAVDADGAVVNLSDSEYTYSIDDDGDDFTNLTERENGTNPFVADTVLPGGDGDGTSEGLGDGDGTTDDGTTDDGSADDDGSTDEADTGTSTDGDSTTDGTTDDATDTGTTTDGSDGDSSDGSTDTGGQTAGSTDDGETDSESTTTGEGTVGTEYRASVLVPRILPRQAPEIDGEDVLINGQNRLAGEWANAVQNDNAGEGLWIDRLMIDNPSNTEDPAVDGDQLHRWAAMHDGEYLYVVVLSDDMGLLSNDSDEVWQDDGLELFIDGNNSRLTEWGDSDDFHFLIALQPQDTDSENDVSTYRVDLGPRPISSPFILNFSTGPDRGPDGIRNSRFEQDVYEIAIPIEDAGITIGQPFGFELQLDDDDNGNSRDSKWGWYHPSRQNGQDTDLTYLNPSVMGTLILEE